MVRSTEKEFQDQTQLSSLTLGTRISDGLLFTLPGAFRRETYEIV